MLDNFRQDLRFAWRGIRRSPTTFAVAAISIAIGIGANTMVYTWLDGLVLRPLPAVPDPDRLVAFNWAPLTGSTGGVPPFSYPAFQGWQTAARSFDRMAAEAPFRLTLRADQQTQPQPAWGLLVTANYFAVADVPAFLGRTFHREEETSAAPVVVLSEPFWRRRFGADSAIIGKHLLVNGADVTVIGVAAPRFVGVVAGLGFDLWIPLTMQPSLTSTGNALPDRTLAWLRGVGRLRPGVTVQEADRELREIARIQSEQAGDRPVTSASVERFRDQQLGSLLFPLLTSVLAVTGIVLVLACCNVANLLMVRAAGRRREIGVRLALGASRARLVSQLLVENGLLAIVGGGLGLLLAQVTRGSFSVFVPPVPEPVAYTLAINPRVMAFAALVTLLTALLFGLVPALDGSGAGVVTALGSHGTGGHRGARLRAVLAVGQLVLSVVALASAGLFLRSLQTAKRVDLGISDPERLLLVATDLNPLRFSEAGAVATLDQLVERLRALPGVTAVSTTTSVPLGFGGHQKVAVTVDGYTAGPTEDMNVERVSVGAGYFEAMGVRILRGRAIDERDLAGTERVAVVNEAFVRRFWPGLDPIGRRLQQGPGWATVVGLAKDGRYDTPASPPYPLVYTALRQWYRPGLTLLVRSRNDPRAIIETARRYAASVNPDLPFLDPRTMAEHMRASTFVQRLGGSVLGSLGVVALLMAALGLYAVVAFGVTERTREIGIRMALGASAPRVLRSVLIQSLRLVVIGLAIGFGLSLAVGQLFRSQLVGVNPGDPTAFGAIAVVLALTAFLASWWPAKRAARCDPIEALRMD